MLPLGWQIKVICLLQNGTSAEERANHYRSLLERQRAMMKRHASKAQAEGAPNLPFYHLFLVTHRPSQVTGRRRPGTSR